jgi:FdhD protein
MNQPLQPDNRAAIVSLPVSATSNARGADEERLVCLAEEVPIAFRYDGFAHGVMMATPADLHDFAVGFSRSEGIIESRSEIQDISIFHGDEGTTVDISLSGSALHRYLASRRVRQLRGHTSCGLCGVEDLTDVRRALPKLRPAATLAAESITAALTALRQWQPLSRHTRGAHASAWVALDGSLRIVREDVGRHNSLDKLIGATLRGDTAVENGFCLITSRCSFEMVQKAVAAGFTTLVSAGTPTGLAVRLAEAASLNLYSLSRDGDPLQFTSPARWEDEDGSCTQARS